MYFLLVTYSFVPWLQPWIKFAQIIKQHKWESFQLDLGESTKALVWMIQGIVASVIPLKYLLSHLPHCGTC